MERNPFSKYLERGIFMAIDRGKQFEYAIMLAAYSRIDNPTLGEQNEIRKLSFQPIEPVVQTAANEMMNNIQPSNPQQFYKSFQQLGGSSQEPKTDVLFIRNGIKYRCSMKWGDAYQLSSAGIQGTVKVLNDVLFKVAMAGGMGAMEVKKVAMVLDELSQTLGEGPKKQPQPVMKAILEEAKRSGGLTEKLQGILGSRKNPEGDKLFLAFKRELVRESLTGAMTFGASNDKTANYILNEKELKPINDKLVNEIADKTYIDIRLKGRGKDPSGVRLNEAVIRIEPVT
jgi:hypothetical protein